MNTEGQHSRVLAKPLFPSAPQAKRWHGPLTWGQESPLTTASTDVHPHLRSKLPQFRIVLLGWLGLVGTEANIPIDLPRNEKVSTNKIAINIYIYLQLFIFIINIILILLIISIYF